MLHKYTKRQKNSVTKIKKNRSSFTHPHIVRKMYDFNSSLKFNCACSLGKNQWGLYGWASVYHILWALCICVGQCLYGNKSPDEICSSYKAIMTLKKTWNKLCNSYWLLLHCLFELFKTSNFCSKGQKKDLNSCYKSIMGLQRHESEQMMTGLSFL